MERDFVIMNGILTEYTGTEEVVYVPDGVEEIGESAFAGNITVRKINLPASVKRIGTYAFSNCTSLTHVEMQGELERVDDFTFRNCALLDSISFLTVKYREPVTAEEKGKAYEAMLLGRTPGIEYLDKEDGFTHIKEIRRYAFSGCSFINEENVVEKIEEPKEEKNSSESTLLRLAPSYIVENGQIYNRKTNMFVRDARIDELELSARSSNCLKRFGIIKISSLVTMTYSKLVQIRNLGTKSANEIQEKLISYLSKHEKTENDLYLDKEDEYKKKETAEPREPIVINLSDSKDPYSDVPMLAPDYMVNDGLIYNRNTLKIIADGPVEKLNLSVRALGGLVNSGHMTISSLVKMSYDDLKKIRRLGNLTANEIIAKLDKYLSAMHDDSDIQATSRYTVSKSDIINCYNQHEFDVFTVDDFKVKLPEASKEDLERMLSKLVDEAKLCASEDGYVLHHITFFSYLEESDLDEKGKFILELRLNDYTLEEIGLKFGITRERVRQIEKTAMRRLTKYGTKFFSEDRYAYLFSKYSIEKEFYTDWLHETEEAWSYLNLRYTRGKMPCENAIEDTNIDKELLRVIDKFLHRKHLNVEGRYLEKNRVELENFVIEKYCRDDVTIEEFFGLYERFLNDYEITDKKLQLTEEMKRARVNRLSDSEVCLWKQNQRLRYYDIAGRDYTELLEALDLGQFENIEISTWKFIIEYPDLMKHYDIRDEYELHNLLKKIHVDERYEKLEFGRMPTIRFGEFDRDSAVKEMLFKSAPISQNDLVTLLSIEYGTKPGTILANWLTGISEYYINGMYSVEHKNLPEEHFVKLKELLIDSFYLIDEIRSIYKRSFPNADLKLISSYNLKRVGFNVYSKYVIQNYSSVEAYFKDLMTKEDVVDMRMMRKRFSTIQIYYQVLNRLKSEMEIIEFEPYQYINVRRLEQLGFGKERLKRYADHVWSYITYDKYFTIKSIRKSGFEDELDGLGFKDMFYSSIIKEDNRFTWQRIGNNVVFNADNDEFTAHDFLVDMINEKKSVDADDLSYELDEVYGVSMGKSLIIEKTKGSEVYYDSIMNKFYADYDIYFEEI